MSKKKAKPVDPKDVTDTADLSTAEPETPIVPVKKAVRKRTAAKTAPSAPSVQMTDASSPVKKAVGKTAEKKNVEPEPLAKQSESNDKAIIDEDILNAVVEVSPVFKKLAEPELPELKRENRAQLQMQTPTRLFFYWSLKADPWKMLRNAFGTESASYTLVLKLKNLTDKTEEMHAVDAVGDWWFNVSAGNEYQAEIGFFSLGRPYFRIVYSNKIATPRRAPSPRPASEARWMVNAESFSQVLDAAGFTRDAYEVALAGDDHHAADMAANTAFKELTGTNDDEISGVLAADLRSAMVSIAAGVEKGQLRSDVGPRIFALLENGSAIDQTRATEILEETFGVDDLEIEEEIPSPAVFGASVVHFPRTRKSARSQLPSRSSYRPVSSFRLR